jgi:hypothetical protein
MLTNSQLGLLLVVRSVSTDNFIVLSSVSACEKMSIARW